ncbi:MAG: nucleotide-binding protein [Methanomicrobiales archaeon]|nr:nucleotide-binding protein [Methanomicrobiales archaeon]MDD1660783.1 nucleotide-binding protein [Methanomicrobiales archaeon]
MIRVLDASAFFAEVPLSGVLFTTPSVVGELRDLRSKGRLESLLAAGLRVEEPGQASLLRVEEAAGRTGDAGVLSPADRDLLALALEREGTVVTDDFAVQNTARDLGIPIQPILQRRARRIRWKFRCPGCGATADRPGSCPVCGSLRERSH